VIQGHGACGANPSGKSVRTFGAQCVEVEVDVIFTRSARGIATGLKRSVSKSSRTKGRSKFQSAMSMLSLHLNRSGRNLSRGDRARLEAAKDELRRAFGRPLRGGGRAGARRKTA